MRKIWMAVATIALAAAVAHAGTVEIKYVNVAKGIGRVNTSVGDAGAAGLMKFKLVSDSGGLLADPDYSLGVNVGEYFYGFCFEMREYANNSTRTYDVVSDLSTLPVANSPEGPMGASGVAALSEIYADYYQGGTPGDWTADEAAGFQIALWEAVYESAVGNTPADALADYFRVTGYATAGAKAHAQSILSGLDGVGTSSLLALSNQGSQDYVFVYFPPDTQLVPVAPAAMLGLPLLGGMGLFRFVRRTRQA